MCENEMWRIIFGNETRTFFLTFLSDFGSSFMLGEEDLI